MNNSSDIRTGLVRFMWDMCPAEYDDLFRPLPEHMHDLSEYDGAVFFGNFKLEFIKNDTAGVYCNLFQYGTEDEPGRAYAYLEDGTPYEERYPESDEITTPDPAGVACRPTFDVFADGIEQQVFGLLSRHPEFIPAATVDTDPDKWYPSGAAYTISDIARDVTKHIN